MKKIRGSLKIKAESKSTKNKSKAVFKSKTMSPKETGDSFMIPNVI